MVASIPPYFGFFPMHRLISAALILLASVTQASAQQTPGLFDSYDTLRARMDPLIEELQIAQMMELFVEVPPAELRNAMATETQMRSLLPEPLTLSDVILVQEFAGGYRQELIAFHDGDTGYLFVRLVLHERENGQIAAVRFTVNVNIDAVLAFF